MVWERGGRCRTGNEQPHRGWLASRKSAGVAVGGSMEGARMLWVSNKLHSTLRGEESTSPKQELATRQISCPTEMLCELSTPSS